MPDAPADLSPADPVTVPFREALRFWLRLGFINFGGPAGQIAIMHRELVDQKAWVSESQFLRALNFCMILPGPEAQQLATYIGWRLHGVLGGLTAGILFVVPSVFVLLFLSWIAAAHATVPAVTGLLYGVQPVVLALVADAVLRVGKRTLHHQLLLAFAVAAFVALQMLHLPFPLVVLAAALAGALLHRRWPAVFASRGHGVLNANHRPDAPPSTGRALRIVAVFLVLWFVPFSALWAWRGTEDVLTREAVFFTQAAFVTFGGAYAVLAYISDVAVNVYGWLDAEQMVHGLALAESTPGPLIMVTQYVGFLAAYRLNGPFDPLVYGVLGALVTTYATFLPCFLFIFLGAPYVEILSGNARLQAALTGVTAAIVGVIANLAVFFGRNVLFPGGQPLDIYALAAAVVAFIILQRVKLPVYMLVPLGGLAGMAWHLATR